MYVDPVVTEEKVEEPALEVPVPEPVVVAESAPVVAESMEIDEEPKNEKENVISASPEKAESLPADEDFVEKDEPEAAEPSIPEIEEKVEEV